LRWFPEFLALGHKRIRSQVRLMGSAVLVGLVAGLAAVIFYVACAAVTHYALGRVTGYWPGETGGEPALAWLPRPEPGTENPLRPWLLLLVPALGGLASGVLVFTVAPEAEGHGTDAVIAAYHHGGKIRPRVPLVKIVASALTIGTGGSGGKEGPITQIGGGAGSVIAELLRLRPRERRILVAAGMGAGIAAIFRTPLAGALFAAEVLYWSPEFEPEVIIPAGLACVISYCTFGTFFGWQPLFAGLQGLSFDSAWQLGPYTLLALCMVVLAMLHTRTFYTLTHQFHHLPLIPHLKPALGALLTGAVGLLLYLAFAWGGTPRPPVLSVLSSGYGVLQDALRRDVNATALVLLAVALGKILTTSLTIGSGGSGGVFGPSMVIGGCGGGALGVLLHDLCRAAWPGLVPHPASFIVVGMGGFFAAAAKTPFTSLIIVVEMTGNYNLLLPALWVCVLSFLLSDEQSLYSSQVEGRSLSPAHQGDYIRKVLASLFVGQFLTPLEMVPALHSGDRLPTILDALRQTSYPTLPVLDAEGGLLGVVSLEEVHLASQSPDLAPFVLAADLMREVTPLQLGDRLDRAVELFVENDVPVLPVVDGSQGHRVLGVVKRADVASSYLSHVHGVAAVRDPAGHH
jgi:CIC family chloride channel protein